MNADDQHTVGTAAADGTDGTAATGTDRAAPRSRLPRIDYDDNQHRHYQRGRALSERTLAQWIGIFATHAPAARPLTVLDLGSGIGRFSPALAEEFGGPVYGVEPSAKMREVAEESATHPRVRYLAGAAEHIPLTDRAADLVLMFLSFHHVADRDAAAGEVARVLAPGGRVLLRSAFADRIPDLRWHRYFPRARSVEEQLFPTVAEAEAAFATAGLRRLAFEEVTERRADSLAETAQRLRFRSISIFEYLTEQEIAEGFARLDADVAAELEPQPVDERSDLLVLGPDAER